METVNVNVKPNNNKRRTSRKKEPKPSHSNAIVKEVAKEVGKIVQASTNRVAGRPNRRNRRNRRRPRLTKELRVARATLGPDAIREHITASDTAIMIIASYTLPYDFPPVRFSSAYTLDRTGETSPFKRYDVPWSPDATAVSKPRSKRILRDASLPADNMVAFAFRNVLRALIYYDPNVDQEDYSYYAMGCSTGEDTIPAATWVVANDLAYDTFVPLKVAYYVQQTAYRPHGSRIYCGSDGESERRYVWAEAATVFTLNVSTTAASVNMAICLDRWTPQGIQECVIITTPTILSTSPVTLSVTTTEAGYYCVSYKLGQLGNRQQQSQTSIFTSTPATPLTFSGVSFGKNDGPVWCHLAAPDYAPNDGVEHTCRVHSVSLMYTNQAAELYREGKITMVQLPAGDNWYSYALEPGVLEGTLDSVTLEAKNGMYGYLKPTQPKDFDMYSYVKVNADQTVIDTHYPLDEDSGFLAMSISIANPLGRKGQFTHVMSYEFKTTNTHRESRKADINPEFFTEAITKVRDMPQFAENPLHFRKLMESAWSAVKRAAGMIEQYGPLAMKAASFIGRAAA